MITRTLATHVRPARHGVNEHEDRDGAMARAGAPSTRASLVYTSSSDCSARPKTTPRGHHPPVGAALQDSLLFPDEAGAIAMQASTTGPTRPQSTICTWILIWLQTLIRAVSTLGIFAFTTAYIPIRLLLAPCCGDAGAICRRKTFKSILITGASSGIGAALAESYATTGVRLVLVARRAGKLRAVEARCKAKGAQVDVMEGDVTNRAAMRTLVTDADTKQPLDLVVANAGVQAEILGDADPLIQSGPTIFDVNCNGVFNTVDPAIELFRQRKAGHLAIMASIASYLPGGGDTWVHYMASKAAMRSYGEGLAMCLAPHNVNVTVLCPGYIASELTAAISHRVPMQVPMSRAINSIKRALAKGDVSSTDATAATRQVTAVIDSRWSATSLIPLFPSGLLQGMIPAANSIFFFGGKNDIDIPNVSESEPLVSAGSTPPA